MTKESAVPPPPGISTSKRPFTHWNCAYGSGSLSLYEAASWLRTILVDIFFGKAKDRRIAYTSESIQKRNLLTWWQCGARSTEWNVFGSRYRTSCKYFRPQCVTAQDWHFWSKKSFTLSLVLDIPFFAARLWCLCEYKLLLHAMYNCTPSISQS